MTDRLIWEKDGLDWPNREASRFVVASGFRWHVQVTGSGPALFLVHGTGASSHSWGAVLPLLASAFTVIAPDLPGHGFTDRPGRDKLSLPGMASALSDLLDALALRPAIAAGHSAGAALIIQMALQSGTSLRTLVSFNGALLPFQGLAGQLFSPLAKVIAQSSVVPWLVARRAANRQAVERLILGTGSHIPQHSMDHYSRLFSSPQHVAGTLGMMANWDLTPFARMLPALTIPLLLVAAENDRTIPPSDAERVKALVDSAEVVRLKDLGHICHEERPDLAASIIAGWASRRAGAATDDLRAFS